jgi:hypothetical protein
MLDLWYEELYENQSWEPLDQYNYIEVSVRHKVPRLSFAPVLSLYVDRPMLRISKR